METPPPPISTNLKPTDLFAFIDQLPTYEGPPTNLDQFIDSVESCSHCTVGSLGLYNK